MEHNWVGRDLIYRHVRPSINPERNLANTFRLLNINSEEEYLKHIENQKAFDKILREQRRNKLSKGKPPFRLRGDATKLSRLGHLFMTLERGLIIEYIFHYLNVSDIIHIDLAMSCAYTRPSFLGAHRVYMTKILRLHITIKDTQFDWLLKRVIRLRKCKLLITNNTNKLRKLFKLFDSKFVVYNLTHITLHETETLALTMTCYGRVKVVNWLGVIRSIAEKCPNLLELTISLSFNVTDELLIALSTGCPNLTLIDIGAKPLTSYTTEGLKALTTTCIHLKTIRLGFKECKDNELCNTIHDVGVCCGSYIDTMYIKLDDTSPVFTTILNNITTELVTYYPTLKNLKIVLCTDDDDEDVSEVPTDALVENEAAGAAAAAAVGDGAGAGGGGGGAVNVDGPVVGNDGDTDQALDLLSTAYPMLEHLSLVYMGFTEHTVELLSRFVNVTHLSIIYSGLYDDDVALLSTVLPHLTHLDFTGCHLTDPGVITLAQNCTKLESLDISEQALLTDASLYALAKHCPKLQVLTMRELVLVTDPGLRAVVKGCPLLRELDLGSCSKLGACIYDICDSCPKLQDLTIPVYDYDIITYLLQHGGTLHRISWGTDPSQHTACDVPLRRLIIGQNYDPRKNRSWGEYKRKYGYTIPFSFA